MKKTILILTCWLLGLAPGMAQQRKMADVQHIADSILNIPTRWGNKARAKKAKTRQIIAASELLGNKQDAFYICDAGADGFAVISSDERMTPVLGFSQSQSFDTENIPTGMQELLNSYAKEYEALTSGKQPMLARRKIAGVQEQVGPLLTTEWGQAEPFNNRCPEWQGERCITGCVAVTTAQTMRYYQFPDSAKGEVDYATLSYNIPIKEDLSTFHFDWPNMRNQYRNGSTEAEQDAVADLLYACAVAAKMNFGLKGSSATSSDQVKAMVENFGYDPDIACLQKDFMTTNEWQTLMLNELNAPSPRPIIYAAVSPAEGGHSFILDGYKADEDGYPFYHVNWGWEGYCDNYFKLSSMDADGWEFSKEHEAIIFIQPDNGKQDNGCFCQANDVMLSTARLNPKTPTQTFNVTMKLFNYSYKAFTGKIEVYLKNEKGEETLVGTSQKINGLPLCYGYNSFSIKANLPRNTAEGDYTVVLRSRADNSETTEIVTYPSPQTLTVTSITESYTPNMMVNELVNMGEEWNGLSMHVAATLPRNNASKAFTGWLQMAVADNEGNILNHFGQVAYITDLQKDYYLPTYNEFRGQLPDYLEDGAYRLYLAANQSGYLEWGKVTGYKMQGSQLVEEEIYIPFWLEDGKIIYHKGGEEELPEDASNIQVMEMDVTSFDADTRHIEMKMSYLTNLGSESFSGQFSMAVYDEGDKLITPFGNPQKTYQSYEASSTSSFGYYGSSFTFSGNLPEELADGKYTVKIAANQNGHEGWSPVKGWGISGGRLVTDIDLAYGFIILNNRMYKEATDGIKEVKNEGEKGEKSDSAVYDLQGRKINSQLSTLNSQLRKGIYITNGKKMVK